MTVKKSTLYALFIVSLLATEFYYIEVGGGVARIYHFVAVAVVLLLIGSVSRLFQSSVFLALLTFLGISLIAAFLSDNPSRAVASLASLFANVGVAIAVALVLVGRKISPKQLVNLVLAVTVLSIFFGLAQIYANKVGVVLALSPAQTNQIQLGFGPGFRTEANTFGKYLLFPFLLVLPAYLKSSRNRSLQSVYLVMIVGMLMNFTRSAIYGLMVSLLFAYLWYAFRGRLVSVSARSVSVLTVAAVGIALILGGFVGVGDYGRYKLANMFNAEEIMEGGSSAYRINSMKTVIESASSDAKRLFIGDGWGETYFEVQGQIVQAGGADLINVLGYNGLLGVLSYLLYSSFVFFALARAARRSANYTQALFAEGLLFAFVGMFVTGLMSGYLISPEYWLLIGASIYVSIIGNSPKKSVRIH